MAASTTVRTAVRIPAPARPSLRSPQARPSRAGVAGRRGRVAACRVAVPSAPAPWALKLKVAAVAALTAVGFAVAVPQLVADFQPGDVSGDPAWAHVGQP